MSHAPSSGSERPLVSLGLPVYNGALFLRPCLDSLLAQTYPNIELIISDNASTDETSEICQSYAVTDPRIRYERIGSNRGAAWNHNHVLDLARGPYFHWCGADDRLEPRFVEVCVEALEQQPEAVLAYCLSIVIDDADMVVDRTTARLPFDAADVASRFPPFLSPLSGTQNPFYGVIRKASLAKVRRLGSFLASDRALLAELAMHGPFVRAEEYLLYRRRHVEHKRRTAAVEQRYLDPTRTRVCLTREWRMLREHLALIARAPVDGKTRLRLLGIVASWALRARGTLAQELRQTVGQLARRLKAGRPEVFVKNRGRS